MIKRLIILSIIFSVLVFSGCTKTNEKVDNSKSQIDPTQIIQGNVTIDLKTANKNVNIEDLFNVSIAMNTRDSSVNSAQLVFDYDTSLLDFDDVVTTGSKFSIWIEKSGKDGRLKLVTAEPNPGIGGAEEFVATAIFKAKKQGTTSIKLNMTESKIFSNENMEILRSEGHTPLDIFIQ